jgi:hypothetical protein
MTDLAFAVAGALTATVLTLSLVAARRRRADVDRARMIDDNLDTIAAWPPQAVRVMTLAERQAYDLIRRAMPGHLVLAQVPLARFISVPTANSYAAWLTRAGRLSADLLLVDNASRPVAAIQIRDVDETDRSAKRRQRLTDVLQAAGIPVHVWQADRLPTPEQARGLLRAPGDTADVHDDGRIPVAQVEVLLSAGDERDYGTDPVASTFFDDFDPVPTPSRVRTSPEPIQVV